MTVLRSRRVCPHTDPGLAVEPLAANVQCLQYNVGDFADRVTIRHVAAWESDTTLLLNEASCHEPGNTSTFSAFLPAADQAWEVPAVCIDTLIDEACVLSPNGRVRLLKIDAEGAEYPTLLTAQQLHLVDEICGESHNNVPWHDELPGMSGLTNRLQELGFVVTHIDNGPNTSIFWARRQPC